MDVVLHYLLIWRPCIVSVRMSTKQHVLHYGRLECLNDMYYIFNAEEEFPIVLAPKSMLYLVRTIGKMQILGNEIEKCLKREKDMTGPCEDVVRTSLV